MMKNKIKLKKFLFLIVIIICSLIAILLSIRLLEYGSYNENFNKKIVSIVNNVSEKYPEVSEREIIETLNSDSTEDKVLKKYSIDIDNDTVIKDNKKVFYVFFIVDIVFYIFTIGLLLYCFFRFNGKRDREINKITKCIENINRSEYSLDLDDVSEDELSILKSEIYKTTIILKEAAENSNKEKLELKNYLSDISHQLKTPLASTLIMLDNLSNEPNMNESTREDFIRDIKREIGNISFLVQSLLKLSKLDTNTVDFDVKDVEVKNIVQESIKNVSSLADLRNIKIKLNIIDDVTIKCDFKWQVEAITNIIKNCVEYALENTNVDIEITDNKVYTQISIKDIGKEIESEDIKYIFERFYKGKNASWDSIGIGLSLAKTIINKDNGTISVEPIKNGAKFVIKYYK